VILLLLLVFLCGSVVGAVAVRYTLKPKVAAGPTYWASSGVEVSLKRLEKELNLTPEQSRQIAQILDDFVKYYHTLQAQMEEVRATGKAKILEVLNPEQREKFQKLIKEAHR